MDDRGLAGGENDQVIGFEVAGGQIWAGNGLVVVEVEAGFLWTTGKVLTVAGEVEDLLGTGAGNCALLVAGLRGCRWIPALFYSRNFGLVV
jgi:hypothetical protein